MRWPNGESLSVFLNSDGLPEKAVFNDLILLFSNYTSNEVDVKICKSNGLIAFQGKMPIKSETIEIFRSFHESEGDPTNLNGRTGRTLRNWIDPIEPIVIPNAEELAVYCQLASALILFGIGALALIGVGSIPALLATLYAFAATQQLTIWSEKYLPESQRGLFQDIYGAFGAKPDITSIPGFLNLVLNLFNEPINEALSKIEHFINQGIDSINQYIDSINQSIDQYIASVILNLFANFWSSGDPHLCTIDGLHYDFQAVGEFVYLESIADPIEMTVQVRQEPYYNSQYVAMNTAVTMSVAGDRVEIYADLSKYQAPLYINGEPAESSETNIWNLPNSGQVNFKNNSYTIIWPDYSQIQVIKRARYLDISGYLPETRKNTLHGIAGNFDGDFANDLMSRDGSITLYTEARITKEKLYNEFGNSWRITQGESLFTYTPGEDTSTYTNLNFPYEIVTTADLSEADYLVAEQICRDAGITDPVLLQDCILDVGFTNDSSFAEDKKNLKSPEMSVTVKDDWILYWDAHKAENDKKITITTNERWKTGMALREGKLNLNADFEKSFEIYMGDNNNGADGMVFLLLSEAPSPDVSIDGGGYLGFETACNGKPCMGIEIDTYRNSSDPSEDHIALIKNGSVNHSSSENENLPLVPLSSDVEDGSTHSVTIGWKQKTKTLSVVFDGNTIMTQENFDIIDILGTSVATYGFSGATGSATNEQYFIPALGF